MRLRISHTTTYRYEPAATGVIQVLRLTPGSHDGQYVADWQIDVSADTRLDMHHDAFGNVTHVLTIGATEDLTITAEGLIETNDTGGVMRGTDERFPPQLFLRSTDLTEASPAMAAFTREIGGAEGDAISFLHALMTRLNDHMTFDSDPTHSGTTAAEAFTLRRGVCQDYAHVFIACARAGGVPARFVVGPFPARRRRGASAGRPRLGRGLCAVARLGRVRSRQRHLLDRRPRPRRDRARLSRRRAGARHPLWRRRWRR